MEDVEVEVRKRRGRASSSFAKEECQWLHAVMMAVLTSDRPDVSALRKHPLAPDVAQKILNMRRAAEFDAEKPVEKQTRRRLKTPDVMVALTGEQPEAAQ